MERDDGTSKLSQKSVQFRDDQSVEVVDYSI